MKHSPQEGGRSGRHTQRHLSKSSLPRSQIHCAPMVFLWLGNNEFTQTQIGKQRPRLKLNQKQELIWKHPGVWDKLGVTPQVCHPMGSLRTACLLDHSDFSSKSLLHRDACLSVHFSFVRCFSGAINHSGSPSGPPRRCPQANWTWQDLKRLPPMSKQGWLWSNFFNPGSE